MNMFIPGLEEIGVAFLLAMAGCALALAPVAFEYWISK